MVEHMVGSLFKTLRSMIWHVLRAALIGALVGGLAAEVAGYFLDGGWPPRLFVNVVAIAFAVIFGYAVAATIAIVEGIQGMVAAATQLDDVAKAAANKGLDALDAVVDAVDGPERHGIR